MKNKKSSKTAHLSLRCLCECAILIAAAQILGYLKIYEMPAGGSVTVCMLPIMLICCRWGAGPGLISGLIFGGLQMLLDGAYAWGWVSILLDYLIAFGVLGFAGFCRKLPFNLVIGSVVGCLLRFASHLISGYYLVRGDASFSIYSIETTSPWLYSAIYNGAYMIINMLILVVIGFILAVPMKKYLYAKDLGR